MKLHLPYHTSDTVVAPLMLPMAFEAPKMHENTVARKKDFYNPALT